MQDLQPITTINLEPAIVKSLEDQHQTIAIESAQNYSDALHSYLLIRASNILIFNSTLNQDMARQLVFAIIEGKPIIVVDAPSFVGVDLFERDFILKRLSQIFIYNLTALDPADRTELIDSFLHGPKLSKYVVTKHEKIIAKSKLKKYFRDFL